MKIPTSGLFTICKAETLYQFFYEESFLETKTLILLPLVETKNALLSIQNRFCCLGIMTF